MAIEDLRTSATMTHLLDALDDGQSIGHYGRLVFAVLMSRTVSRTRPATSS
jgi:hypothetical protein